MVTAKFKPSSNAFLLPSLVFATFVLFQVEVREVSPPSLSKWAQNKGVLAKRVFTFNQKPKDCFFVAMIITSEEDYKNGTIDAWFRTIPQKQSNRVCCISIRRSTTTSFRYNAGSGTCDMLFVPMIRDDEYLTISEKVQLGFEQISSIYNFKWLLKTDADSFICFSRMLNLVNNYDSEGVITIGYAESRNILLEDPAHKWYDPSMTDIVHNSRQPVISGTGLYHPYMQGAGYILSRGALQLIDSVLPSLRYSPMEDAMVGSWILAFNAHRAVLNLDLRGERGQCRLPHNLYISHSRKGSRMLDLCHERNEDCADMSSVKNPHVNDVAFLVTSNMGERGKLSMDIYDSIRAMFPTNEILFGDMSGSNDFLRRLLVTKNDERLNGFSFPGMPAVLVRNELVNRSQSTYVCILQDVQRLSWETMIGRMLLPVQWNEVDISSGFLSFNPHMLNSSFGLFKHGYNISIENRRVIQKEIEGDFFFPNATYNIQGTSGFILARKGFLLRFPWRNYGTFAEDEFYLRLHQRKARLRLINSGVRHGYHYPLVRPEIEVNKIRKYGSWMCQYLSNLKENVIQLEGMNQTLNCGQRIFRQSPSEFNVTNSNLTLKW